MKNFHWKNPYFPSAGRASIDSLDGDLRAWASQFKNGLPYLFGRASVMKSNAGRSIYPWSRLDAEAINYEISLVYEQTTDAIDEISITTDGSGGLYDVDTVRSHILLDKHLFCAKLCTTVVITFRRVSQKRSKYVVVAIAGDRMCDLRETIYGYLRHTNLVLKNMDVIHPSQAIKVIDDCRNIYSVFGNLPTERFMRAAREYDVKKAIHEADKNLAAIDPPTRCFMQQTLTGFRDAVDDAISLGRKVNI